MWNKHSVSNSMPLFEDENKKIENRKRKNGYEELDVSL